MYCIHSASNILAYYLHHVTPKSSKFTCSTSHRQPAKFHTCSCMLRKLGITAAFAQRTCINTANCPDFTPSISFDNIAHSFFVSGNGKWFAAKLKSSEHVFHFTTKMVFYFTSNVVSPSVTLFMGLDKYENEDLIKWGWPEDVWFHVDKVSSAHVYLRLPPGQTIDDIPTAVLEDAAQLVKANSITGNKMNDVDVVYTMWANLKKTDGMEVGQVGFHKDKEVRKIRVAKRSNEIVNRLNKTKREEHPDFRNEREQRDKKEREDKKKLLREQREKEKEEERRKKEEAELRSYSTLMKAENMTSNCYNDGNDSDDFM